ncbi:hypothetical protein FOMPIDRAFT_93077, partial [Fomitopsis schrenkii]
MSAPTSFSAPLTSNSGPNTLDGVDPSLAQDGLGNTSDQSEALKEVERVVAEANEKLWVIIGRRLVDEQDEDEVWPKVQDAVGTLMIGVIGKVTPHIKAGRLLNIPRFIAAAIHMTLLVVKHEANVFRLSWVRPDSFLFKDVHWLDPQSPSGIPPPGLVHPATTTSGSNEENIGENNEEPQPSGGPSTAGRRVPRKDKGKQRARDVEDAPVAGHKRPREDSDSGGDGDAPPEDESEPEEREDAARGRKAAKRPRGILKNSVDMDTIIDDPKPKLRTAGWHMPEGSVPGRKKAWEKVRPDPCWRCAGFPCTYSGEKALTQFRACDYCAHKRLKCPRGRVASPTETQRTASPSARSDASAPGPRRRSRAPDPIPRTVTTEGPRTRSRSRARSQSRGRAESTAPSGQAGPSKPRGRSQTRKPKDKAPQAPPKGVENQQVESRRLQPAPTFEQMAFSQAQLNVTALRKEVGNLQARVLSLENQNAQLLVAVNALILALPTPSDPQAVEQIRTAMGRLQQEQPPPGSSTQDAPTVNVAPADSRQEDGPRSPSRPSATSRDGRPESSPLSSPPSPRSSLPPRAR